MRRMIIKNIVATIRTRPEIHCFPYEGLYNQIINILQYYQIQTTMARPPLLPRHAGYCPVSSLNIGYIAVRLPVAVQSSGGVQPGGGIQPSLQQGGQGGCREEDHMVDGHVMGVAWALWWPFGLSKNCGDKRVVSC